MDSTNSGDVEPPKDPGVLKKHSSFTDNEIQGEKATTTMRDVLKLVFGLSTARSSSQPSSILF